MKPQLWERVAGYVGRSLSPAQNETLHSFREWLEQEAVPAGGLGPAEIGRLDDRHIADSLLFYAGWGSSQPPESIWDLGSGVGLPGIPLAVLIPETEVTLVDRSGRRADLARRAVRVLALDNVIVTRADIADISGRASMLVARAVTGPDQLQTMIREHLAPGGRAVVGGSWVTPPEEKDWEIKEIPPDLLDRPIWLLIMRG